jgi:phosphonate dehydrogenase
LRALASRLRVFGTEIVYHDEHRLSFEEELALGLRYAERDALLAAADFVFPFLPLTPTTHHLIDAAALGRMKPGSYLVNCGRGSLVDEAAVAEALRSGQLAGYAADVFEMEDWARPDRPRAVTPALLAPELNTLFTPHLGSAVDEVRREIEREAARRVEEWHQGDRPRHAINDLDVALQR